MFCDKENVNILTSLLVAHNVKHAVVCPGSRNAAIVHNLNECAEITCYPVTDERSAGFYALGISLAVNAPVVVCVTSGSAVLNLAPAVAEATYRHHGLIVITADRPEAWIGQLDGQTITQPWAFGVNTGRCVCLPEPHNDEERWFCNRLVNEALLSVSTHSRKSVQINVPISEPLFNFTVAELPKERKIETISAKLDKEAFINRVLSGLFNAKRPMIVLGQISSDCETLHKYLFNISKCVVVTGESLSVAIGCDIDMTLKRIKNAEQYLPDFIIYLGDTLVSKQVKKFFRQAKSAECWAVCPDAEVHDVFMNLHGVIEADPLDAVRCIANSMTDNKWTYRSDEFVKLWQNTQLEASNIYLSQDIEYSQLMAVRDFYLSLELSDFDWHVHCANSMAVRLSQLFTENYIWCNRGVNGIEGCVSTAAGFSCATSDMVFCITGDLSFFYDSNALWNQNLRGNLRIMILNNGGGAIFSYLPGLSDSPALSRLVSAEHKTTAKGLCEDNDIGYLCAHNSDELSLALARFLTIETGRPLVLEVFTDTEKDKRIYIEYNNGFKK